MFEILNISPIKISTYNLNSMVLPKVIGMLKCCTYDFNFCSYGVSSLFRLKLNC